MARLQNPWQWQVRVQVVCHLHAFPHQDILTVVPDNPPRPPPPPPVHAFIEHLLSLSMISAE